MEQIIQYRWNKQVGKFLQESIEIPEGVSRLLLEGEFTEGNRCMGVIIAEDPLGKIRLQRFLSYGDLKIGISNLPEETSPGAVVGNIQEGTWKFSVGFLTDETIRFELKISDRLEILSETLTGGSWVDSNLVMSRDMYSFQKLYQLESGWYKGDFHTHTRLSDGKETLEGAMKKALDMKMDFYTPTEHNVIHTGWCKTPLLILPGIEITTEKGHMNLIGITKMPEKVMELVTSTEENEMERCMMQIIQEGINNGWITSINHPFLTIWKWKYEMTKLNVIDCIEIINDPTYPYAPQANEKALNFWDELWKDGHKIWGIGGSDSHNLIHERYEGANDPSIISDPGTYVFCEGLSPENLIEGVKQGRICVSRFCRIIPEITIDERKYFPGDEIPNLSQTIDYLAYILESKMEPEVSIVVDGFRRNVKVEKIGENSYKAEATVCLQYQNWHWVRLEVRSKDKKLLGFTNPIYTGNKNSKYRTYGEILKEVETRI